MKKINALFTLIMVATMILTGCTLPARGTPAPTGDTSGAVQATATSVSIPAQSTDTGVLPTATALPAVMDTSQPGAAYPPPATAVPLEPSATPLPAASRILFTSGATSATVEGDLDAGQTLYYVIEGAAGQSMDVDLSSPTSNVYLGVTAATTGGALLDALLQDANWTGTLPAAQDYYLSVTAGGASTTYSLTVALSPLSSAPAPTATATTAPPLVDVPFNPVAQFGEPDFEDPMTGSSISDWEDEDGDLPDTLYIRLALTDARFYVTGKLAGFSTWYFTWRELSDFYLQATMDSGTCSGQDAYGLIVRGPAHMAGVSYGYVVAFTCDGKVWVFRLDDADPFTIHDLVSLTPSTYINSGPNQRNLIGIQAVGDTLTIYANGHQVAQVVDDHYDFGRIGVFVSPQWTPFYTYRVVNYSLWDLGE